VKKEIIVGYANTYHDPAMAFVEGDLIFAEAIERPAQEKRARWKAGIGYTPSALRKALASAGIEIDREKILHVRSTWSFTWIERAFLLGLRAYWKVRPIYGPLPRGIPSELASLEKVSAYSVSWFRGAVPLFCEQLAHAASRGRASIGSVKPVRHHLTHAANAVFTSPFEECVVMVLDGQGERHGASFYRFEAGKFHDLAHCTHSFGFLYARVTTLCGFSPVQGEEWKVMGMAAYGKKNPAIYEFFRSRTKVKGLHYELSFPEGCWAELEKICGGFRTEDEKDPLASADLAASFQEYFTDVVVELARNLKSLGHSGNLAYAGGCALNSSTNGRLLRGAGFAALHVPSAPADDGNALGAALFEKYVKRKSARKPAYGSPYLGQEPDYAMLEQVLAFGHFKHRRFTAQADLVEAACTLLEEGKILGWMQGRAEFGPRALGNRSILADPRDPRMKDRINQLVKFRESYRPIAPSMLHERGHDWFEDYQFSPYMERTLAFRQNAKNKVPAVVHEDGTGRVQSVTRELNPLYHELLSRFERRTGVPMLVNTSLNVMGRPIVHGIEDSLTLFTTTGLHAIAIGNFLLEKV
jgi:carbamoyltransferase